ESFGAFMYGRNGMDQLSQFMLYLSLFLMIVSVILLSAFRRSSIASTILDYAAIVILIFSYFRAFSHKVEKRRKENLKYLNAIHPISNWFRLRRQRFEMRENYKLFLCPKCKTTLRVPKGKGRINLTCPRCHTKFEGKS
ncbi:MAG: hypothetical protein VB068_01710, partial [Petrimonas sp.]|nr:hypothetical protein [Petrimonas sp.]